jgi:hypothetical protein
MLGSDRRAGVGYHTEGEVRRIACGVCRGVVLCDFCLVWNMAVDRRLLCCVLNTVMQRVHEFIRSMEQSDV